MVIYVSPAEKNGGILQFSTTMLKETVKSREGKLFLPDSVEDKYYYDIADKVVLYQKVKTLNAFSSEVRDLAQMVLHEKPDCVVFLEDSLLMQQLNYLLVKKSIKTAVVVHDVVHHPYRNMNMRAILVDLLRRIGMRITVNQDTSILLLSDNSKKKFSLEYNKKRAKLLTMILGAHVPNIIDIKPKEIPQMDNYYLFFGRIDKYKGIGDLCQAYTALPDEIKEKHRLIIAGNGKFSEREETLIKNDSNIYVINRFIEDGEMTWLYGNAKAVVLPYIEASQSGVLPIAYYFSKPVIVSNQEGLLENIEEGETGYSYRTISELSQCLEKILYAEMENEICKYYDARFNWQNNICKILEEIECGKNTDL